MPSENEELDVGRNARWRPFTNLLRGGASLNDDAVLREFDRCLIPSLRRTFKLLKVQELIFACLKADASKINELRKEHRKQRDRAETFFDQITQTCRPGMTYREAVDAFLHSACARIIDQAALMAVPSDNFPTLEDYRQVSAIWQFRMEERIAKTVDQILLDPQKLRTSRRNKLAEQQQLSDQLGWSIANSTHVLKDKNHDDELPHRDSQS